MQLNCQIASTLYCNWNRRVQLPRRQASRQVKRVEAAPLGWLAARPNRRCRGCCRRPRQRCQPRRGPAQAPPTPAHRSRLGSACSAALQNLAVDHSSMKVTLHQYGLRSAMQQSCMTCNSLGRNALCRSEASPGRPGPRDAPRHGSQGWGGLVGSALWPPRATPAACRTAPQPVKACLADSQNKRQAAHRRHMCRKPQRGHAQKRSLPQQSAVGPSYAGRHGHGTRAS